MYSLKPCLCCTEICMWYYNVTYIKSKLTHPSHTKLHVVMYVDKHGKHSYFILNACKLCVCNYYAVCIYFSITDVTHQQYMKTNPHIMALHSLTLRLIYVYIYMYKCTHECYAYKSIWLYVVYMFYAVLHGHNGIKVNIYMNNTLIAQNPTMHQSHFLQCSMLWPCVHFFYKMVCCRIFL